MIYETADEVGTESDNYRGPQLGQTQKSPRDLYMYYAQTTIFQELMGVCYSFRCTPCLNAPKTYLNILQFKLQYCTICYDLC